MSLFRYKGSKVWSYEFQLHGQRIRETSGTRSKTLARKIEQKRRLELEHGAAGIKKPEKAQLFSKAAADWLILKSATLRPRSLLIAQAELGHLLPAFGKKMLPDIEATHIALYQRNRLADGASNRTVNMEVGTLRAILKRSGHWAKLLPDVTMLKARRDVGKALTPAQALALEKSCSESRSRSLLPMVILAMETGSRYGTIKALLWRNVDFEGQRIIWGKDKRDEGRTIPMSTRAASVLAFWAANFPQRLPEHYVFAYERYGAVGNQFANGESKAYDTDPTKPIGSIKSAWNEARKRAGITHRFHDLRHTAVSRMINAGVPLTKVAQIVGWAPSTTVMMATVYGHHRMDELRSAVEAISPEPPQLTERKEKRVH
jgi:integrase